MSGASHFYDASTHAVNCSGVSVMSAQLPNACSFASYPFAAPKVLGIAAMQIGGIPLRMHHCWIAGSGGV